VFILAFLPFMVLALAGVSGLGFFFGGITMLFKRIQSYLQIIQYALIFLVAVDPTGVFRWLPATLPTHWVRQVMVYDQNLSQVPGQDWLNMALVAGISVTMGVAVFKLCELKARRQGIIGHF